MDANKLKVLRQIGYSIAPTCGSCVFSEILPGSEYGACSRHVYVHQKHSEPVSPLSVNRGGHCSAWQPAQGVPEYRLGAWAEFFKDPHGLG